MVDPHWDEKSVFLAALALPPNDREPFLNGACPTPEARQRILALIRALEETPTGAAAPLSRGEPEPRNPSPRPSSANPSPLLPTDPLRIGEFTLLGRIGQGGMGVVYLARDTVLQRQVAIKVLASHLTGSEEALGRFRDEAKTAALLQNPGIVQVHRFGDENGLHYIVSEYVAGLTLKELIAQESLRRTQTQTTVAHAREWRRRIAEIIARVAEALDHSHRAGVVHRDVKPSNILIDEAGNPKLNDFGIAKHLSPDVTADFTQGIGSFHYMSPEQADVASARVDRRSDIFSLGVVLYESLTLRKPFDGSSPEDILVAVRTRDPAPLRSLDPHIPRDLETICLKALEKSPDRRYQTAMYFEADLRGYLAGTPIMARPSGVTRRALRWAQAHRALVNAAVIGFLALSVAGLLWLQSSARDAASCWLSVESTPPGLSVYVQPYDPTTLTLLPAALSGTTPFRDQRLSVGQYRVTVATGAASTFAEFNAVFLRPGKDHQLVLLAQPPGQESLPSPAPTSPAALRRASIVPSSQVIADDMVLIPAGEYEFGWSDEPDPVIHRRPVQVDAFYIDRTLVSNAQYRAFVEATGRTPPQPWLDGSYDPSFDDKPVVGVTALDAEAYANWRGKRLPTAFEWQAAARGPDKRRFPWGNNPDPARGIEPSADEVLRDQSWDSKILYSLYARHCPSTRAPDGMEHPLGLNQMYGPLRETTGTFNPAAGTVLIVGRAWSDSPSATDMTRVFDYPIENFSYKHGFRCARSAAPRALSNQTQQGAAEVPTQDPPPVPASSRGGST